jgi:hypothetical protein
MVRKRHQTRQLDSQPQQLLTEGLPGEPIFKSRHRGRILSVPFFATLSAFSSIPLSSFLRQVVDVVLRHQRRDPTEWRSEQDRLLQSIEEPKPRIKPTWKRAFGCWNSHSEHIEQFESRKFRRGRFSRGSCSWTACTRLEDAVEREPAFSRSVRRASSLRLRTARCERLVSHARIVGDALRGDWPEM